jgi:hypothetical protein
MKRELALRIGGSSSMVDWVVMICPALAIEAMRAATLTASPNTSPASRIAGPWCRPMRMASEIGPVDGLSTTSSSSISCISQAAETALSAVGNVHISSSPMVLMTEPPWRLVTSVRICRQLATCARAGPSPRTS